MNSNIEKIGKRKAEKKKKDSKKDVLFDFSFALKRNKGIIEIHSLIQEKLLLIHLEKIEIKKRIDYLKGKNDPVFNGQRIDMEKKYDQYDRYPNQHEYTMMILDFIEEAYLTQSDKQAELKEKYLDCLKFLKLGNNSRKEEKKCCDEKEFDINEDSEYVCSHCGLIQDKYFGNSAEYMSYDHIRDTFSNIKQQPIYKRSGHLKEKLEQKLVKTKNSVPKEVVESVKEQLKKEKIEDLSVLKPNDIRRILKKLGLEKYYEMDYTIFHLITNIKIIEFDNQLINQIENMFDQVVKTFNEIKNKGRSSMFVYDYTIHKLLELLSLDEYKKHFKPPKNPEKIIEYDRLWKKICKQLNWQFISTKIT